MRTLIFTFLFKIKMWINIVLTSFFKFRLSSWKEYFLCNLFLLFIIFFSWYFLIDQNFFIIVFLDELVNKEYLERQPVVLDNVFLTYTDPEMEELANTLHTQYMLYKYFGGRSIKSIDMGLLDAKIWHMSKNMSLVGNIKPSTDSAIVEKINNLFKNMTEEEIYAYTDKLEEINNFEKERYKNYQFPGLAIEEEMKKNSYTSVYHDLTNKTFSTPWSFPAIYCLECLSSPDNDILNNKNEFFQDDILKNPQEEVAKVLQLFAEPRYFVTDIIPAKNPLDKYFKSSELLENLSISNSPLISDFTELDLNKITLNSTTHFLEWIKKNSSKEHRIYQEDITGYGVLWEWLINMELDNLLILPSSVTTHELMINTRILPNSTIFYQFFTDKFYLYCKITNFFYKNRLNDLELKNLFLIPEFQILFDWELKITLNDYIVNRDNLNFNFKLARKISLWEKLINLLPVWDYDWYANTQIHWYLHDMGITKELELTANKLGLEAKYLYKPNLMTTSVMQILKNEYELLQIIKIFIIKKIFTFFIINCLFVTILTLFLIKLCRSTNLIYILINFLFFAITAGLYIIFWGAEYLGLCVILIYGAAIPVLALYIIMLMNVDVMQRLFFLDSTKNFSWWKQNTYILGSLFLSYFSSLCFWGTLNLELKSTNSFQTNLGIYEDVFYLMLIKRYLSMRIYSYGITNPYDLALTNMSDIDHVAVSAYKISSNELLALGFMLLIAIIIIIALSRVFNPKKTILNEIDYEKIPYKRVFFSNEEIEIISSVIKFSWISDMYELPRTMYIYRHVEYDKEYPTRSFFTKEVLEVHIPAFLNSLTRLF